MHFHCGRSILRRNGWRDNQQNSAHPKSGRSMWLSKEQWCFSGRLRCRIPSWDQGKEKEEEEEGETEEEKWVKSLLVTTRDGQAVPQCD